MTTERLTHFEELDLVKRYQQTGDKRILDKIVVANLGLVHKIVHKFPIKNCSVTYDDLFQEGVTGLIRGITKFDTSRGCRLSTYCYNWIQAMVRRYFANHGRSVRLPVHITDAQLSLNKVVESLTHELGRTPTLCEVTERCPDAPAIMNDVKAGLSLNAPVGDDSELEDLQADDKTDSFEAQVDVDILLSKLQDNVSARDYDILVRRFGLSGHIPHTLNELGEMHSITRARCHQIEVKLIKQLRLLSV